MGGDGEAMGLVGKVLMQDRREMTRESVYGRDRDQVTE